MMKISVVIRIALWAGAGFLVTTGWAVYYASIFGTGMVEPAVEAFANLTQPVVSLVRYSGWSQSFGVTGAVVWNTATYGIIGLIVETIRQHYRPVRVSD